MVKAVIWRALMAVGMKIHNFADPKPPSPTFTLVIPSRLSPRGGSFKLVFYVPDGYFDAPDDYRFPVVVNYHGGGFTLGTATDDARWAACIVRHVYAVFVSVEYRLAPEYPFSVGVEDGTDAVIYLASHAEELQINPHQMALSGFSAGGNFALTVPLMLHDLRNHSGRRMLGKTNTNPTTNPLNKRRRLGEGEGDTLLPIPSAPASPPTAAFTPSSSTLSLPVPSPVSSRSPTGSVYKLTDLQPTALEVEQAIPDLTLKALVSFYPPTDFRISREEKRITNPQPGKNLPLMLTSLFDASYMHQDGDIALDDPYLSPAAASDALLTEAYPDEIILYTCEYDMLNAEGTAFGERLAAPPIAKTVHGGLIKSVVHGFDKKPNPISFPASADRCYAEACAELKRIFGGPTSFEERRQLEKSKPVYRFSDENERGEDEPGEDGDGHLIDRSVNAPGESSRAGLGALI
ncbi:uncharacterized protein BP5553_04122 [Venustampulla echinocandica]|uniref:Alpha/beta hydrolase fold-3 domain-containing protein n=1 Tax=Venustampulla echinocandica TaxID=2656787 RepID=A0A370TW80_9HELO|nr:uncharacterized protein BP5553_04122 [Venustampulla echinocandica]RDL39782.1 hypothetical protein BP5553_04122 [Venustampulla echinocandica]